MVYSKPELYVERFLPNQKVTACDPSTEVQSVTVSCLIKSGDQEGVFYDGCDYVASSNYLKTIDADDWDKNGQDDYAPLQYLCWYGPSDPNSRPDSGSIDTDGTKTGTKGALLGQWLMDAFTKAGFNQFSGSNVLHAGLATPNVLSIINQS